MVGVGLHIVSLLVIADLAFNGITKASIMDVDSRLGGLDKINVNSHVDSRRKTMKSKERLASSSSEEKISNSKGHSSESIELSSTLSKSKDKKRNRLDNQKLSIEEEGWQKGHRKCPQCPQDMAKKWRDPTIRWICGAYQRARRSFKSSCMMHFRNCQDGTMFVKIHDNRCQNDSENEERPHGEHFFYDYKASVGVDSSKSEESFKIELDDSS